MGQTKLHDSLDIVSRLQFSAYFCICDTMKVILVSIFLIATMNCGNAAFDCGKLRNTLDCVAEYARRGECDWNNWSSMAKDCDVFFPLNKILISYVKSGQCTWSNWSRGVYQPIMDLSKC